MRVEGRSCGVSANEYSCTHHVTWSPNKLWRSTSIFNLCSLLFVIMTIRGSAKQRRHCYTSFHHSSRLRAKNPPPTPRRFVSKCYNTINQLLFFINKALRKVQIRPITHSSPILFGVKKYTKNSTEISDMQARTVGLIFQFEQ